jgi:MarR family transcriptional regulator, negative regulator of the multidrug operon emrRAB
MSGEFPTHLERIEGLKATIERIKARGLPTDVDHALLFRSLLMAGRALQALSDEAMVPTGLSEPEFRVLMQLYSQPGGLGSPGELCSGVWQSPANMTRITDQLVARGLISREPSEQDRRRMVLAVTPAGDLLVRTIVPHAFEPIRTVFKPFTAEQRALLQALVTQLLHSLDELHARAPTAPAGSGAN